MRTFLVAFAISLLISLLLTPYLRDLSIRRNWVDAPVGGRKIHTMPIPRLGGVAIIISMIVPILGLWAWDNRLSLQVTNDIPLLYSFFGGTAILAVVGIWDDLYNLRAVLKLCAQICAALVVFYAGIQIEVVTLPLYGPIYLGMMSLPITIFWFVLVINAVNLIDGMDGLAGSVVVLSGATLFIMGVIEENNVAALLLIAMVGASLGFLVFNLNPASIFLGDTGSMFLGFVLALAAVHSSQKSYTLFSIVSAFMVLALPIFDLIMAVSRRFLSGKPLFSADQHHIHHQLLRKGLSQKQSMGLLFLAAMFLEGLALTSIYADDRIAAICMIAMLPIAFFAVRFLGYRQVIRKARSNNIMVETEAESKRRLRFLKDVVSELTHKDTYDALIKQIQKTAENLRWKQVFITQKDVVIWSWPSSTDNALDNEEEQYSKSETVSAINAGEKSTVLTPTQRLARILQTPIHIQNQQIYSYTLSTEFDFHVVQLSEEQVFSPMDEALLLILVQALGKQTHLLKVKSDKTEPESSLA